LELELELEFYWLLYLAKTATLWHSLFFFIHTFCVEFLVRSLKSRSRFDLGPGHADSPNGMFAPISGSISV
jgi:hypothetical protein